MTYYEKCVEWFDKHSKDGKTLNVKIARKVVYSKHWEAGWISAMDRRIGLHIIIKKEDIDIWNTGIRTAWAYFPIECFDILDSEEQSTTLTNQTTEDPHRGMIYNSYSNTWSFGFC